MLVYDVIHLLNISLRSVLSLVKRQGILEINRGLSKLGNAKQHDETIYVKPSYHLMSL